MGLVAAWELIALDDREDGGQRVTAVAETIDGSLRLVTADVDLTEAQAEQLRIAGGVGPFRR